MSPTPPSRDPSIVKIAEMLARTAYSRTALTMERVQEQALADFRDLRERMSASADSTQVALCSLGVRLMEHLVYNAMVGPEDLRDLLAEVTSQLHASLSWGSAGKPVEESDSTPPALASNNRQKPSPGTQLASTAIRSAFDSASPLQLSLCDGRRLGELLVTLSMLSQEQVNQALRVQQEEGVKLGEALVRMGLLTSEMVESALRVQRQRRDVVSDPWDRSHTKGQTGS